MDLLEAIEKRRTIRKFSAPPAEEQLERILEAGAKAVILKGIEPRWILETISEEQITIVWLLVPWALDLLFAVAIAISSTPSVFSFQLDTSVNFFFLFVVLTLVSTFYHKGSPVASVMGRGFTGLMSHKDVFVPFQGQFLA